MLDRNHPSTPASYTPEDLQGGWEFKVVQSGTPAFRRPEVLQKVREEEAQAGWVLLEKIDDAHLRFKRPSGARFNDHNLQFDAYRTRYDNSAAIKQLIFWLCIVAGAIALYFFFAPRA